MMRHTVRCGIALLLAVPVVAGDRQPDPGRRFELSRPVEQPKPATPSEATWVEYLGASLREAGATSNVFYRFARAKAQLTVNGERIGSPVYVLRDKPDIFLVTRTDTSGRISADFLVDFKQKTVRMLDWGDALHVPPSRSFAVAVFDGDKGLGGIPVAGDSGNPTFRERVASWH